VRPNVAPLRDGAPRPAGAEGGASNGRRSPRSSVQSVARACDILVILGASNVPLSALEIARASGLDRTVVHRLLRTLAECDIVFEERGTYGIGPASLLLANRYLDQLFVRRLALPYLLDLQASAIGDEPWTVTLMIPVGDVATVVERIWTRSAPLGMVLEIGDTFPIDRAAAGRSVLAYRQEETVRALIGDDRYATVAPILVGVRERGGLALSRGEAVGGVYALAAAIRSRRGRAVAAVAVSGVELGDQLAYDSLLAVQLRRTAQAIGQALP
jgi:IclR family acetate operon transcriptional repressor